MSKIKKTTRWTSLNPVRLGAVIVLVGAAGACGSSASPTASIRPEGEATSSQRISQGFNALIGDPGASAVVRITGTNGTCTGTLVTPYLVLTAAHCFGNASTPGIGGVDTNCWVENFGTLPQDANHVVTQQGCGQAVFTLDINTPARDTIPIKHVWVNGNDHPFPPGTIPAGSQARDIAVALLSWRASPSTIAQSVPVPPLIENDPGNSFWQSRNVHMFGWGFVDPISDNVDNDTCGSGFWQLWNQATTKLQEHTTRGLDGSFPVNSKDLLGNGLGAPMFQMLFGRDTATDGQLLPGDSGGPMYFTDPNGVFRVGGVTSFVQCNDSPTQEETSNMWAITDGQLNNQTMMRQLVAPGNPAGTTPPPGGLFGDTHSPCKRVNFFFNCDPDGDGVCTGNGLCTPAASVLSWQKAVGIPVESKSEADNCPTNANPDQKDTDGDSDGDACNTL